MPRTADEIAHTDEIATDIGYVDPPAHLAPTGKIYEDRTWEALVDWFDDHTKSFGSAVLVYISRRWDTPTSDAYVLTDNWMKAQHRRKDIESDPEGVEHAYGN